MSYKILFMGTPEFSVPILKSLNFKHKITCVFTQPPKKKSRGQKILKSPVHLEAEKLNIPIRHPKNLDSNIELDFIKNSKIEGKDSGEWKLVDGIDLIVHIFHPEKRRFYELEKMWSELIPKEKLII